MGNILAWVHPVSIAPKEKMRKNSRKNRITRMHSSRMRTAHLLSVSPSMHCSGGVPGPRGVYLVLGDVPCPRRVPGLRGVYLVLGGCTWSRGCNWSLGGVPAQALPAPVNRMTDRCKNITLPQTSFAGGNNVKIGNH